MEIRPASPDKFFQWLSAMHYRPAAMALAVVMVLGSLNYVTAAPPSEDPFGDIAKGSPHDVLALNPQGKVVPKPQSDQARDRIAREIANSVENGRAKGYFKVTDDLDVTITDEGRNFAKEALEKESKGCIRVTDVTADWVGFHVKVEETCSPEEVKERFDIDINADPEPETGAAPTQILSSGLAPGAPSRPLAEPWVNSDDFDCSGQWAGVGAVIGALFLAVVLLPWAGWFIFIIELVVGGLQFYSSLVSAISNCTQLLSSRAEIRRWVTREPGILPIATVGLGGALRVQDALQPPADSDAYWITSTVYCRRMYYSWYRYSRSTGTNVPTFVRWNCP